MSLTTVDAGLLSSNAQQVGFKNRIIDGGFILNQRGYVSGVSLASGTYGHDRWKGGASAGTYTFTQGALGVNTTITITAGSIIQVIEGCNLAEGGTYVLSWSGTAQGRLNGGSYGTSGTVTVTGWTAGTNLNVEFNTGTLGSVQLEKGSTATSFDYRPYGTELALCQRYYCKLSGENGRLAMGYNANTTQGTAVVNFPVTMRIAPTAMETTGAAIDYGVQVLGSTGNCSAVPTFQGASTLNATAVNYFQASLVAGQGGVFSLKAGGLGSLAFSAEL